MAKKIIKFLFFAVYRIKMNFEEKEEDNVFTIASKSRKEVCMETSSLFKFFS